MRPTLAAYRATSWVPGQSVKVFPTAASMAWPSNVSTQLQGVNLERRNGHHVAPRAASLEPTTEHYLCADVRMKRQTSLGLRGLFHEPHSGGFILTKQSHRATINVP